MLSPVRLSVGRLSVTPVHPILRRFKFSAIFLQHLVPWPFVNIRRKFYGNRPRGTHASGELNPRGVVKLKYSDFGPIEGYISETVQDGRYVSINHLGL